jgi:hypothetical protein
MNTQQNVITRNIDQIKSVISDLESSGQNEQVLSESDIVVVKLRTEEYANRQFDLGREWEIPDNPNYVAIEYPGIILGEE